MRAEEIHEKHQQLCPCSFQLTYDMLFLGDYKEIQRACFSNSVKVLCYGVRLNRNHFPLQKDSGKKETVTFVRSAPTTMITELSTWKYAFTIQWTMLCNHLTKFSQPKLWLFTLMRPRDSTSIVVAHVTPKSITASPIGIASKLESSRPLLSPKVCRDNAICHQ